MTPRKLPVVDLDGEAYFFDLGCRRPERRRVKNLVFEARAADRLTKLVTIY